MKFLPPEPLTRGLPPSDRGSLCPLSSTEFVEPPPPQKKKLGTPLLLAHKQHFNTRVLSASLLRTSVPNWICPAPMCFQLLSSLWWDITVVLIKSPDVIPSAQSDLHNAPPTAVSPASSTESFLHSLTAMYLSPRHYLASYLIMNTVHTHRGRPLPLRTQSMGTRFASLWTLPSTAVYTILCYILLHRALWNLYIGRMHFLLNLEKLKFTWKYT